MQVNAKQFAARLNRCLDESGAPSQIRERAAVLSKMLDIPKQQAWSLLQGQIIPNDDLLLKIANEFEIEPQWLCGET